MSFEVLQGFCRGFAREMCWAVVIVQRNLVAEVGPCQPVLEQK